MIDVERIGSTTRYFAVSGLSVKETCLLCTQSQSFGRRDLLLRLQETAQQKWSDAKLFEEDAPIEGEQNILVVCIQ